ncbi:hypothetical protein HDV05_006922, partial [Chytridiales sp. JEL 0842]
TYWNVLMDCDQRHPLKYHAFCDHPEFPNGNPMILNDEEWDKFLADKQRRAPGEPPPTIPLKLVLRCALVSVIPVVATNFLSFLPQIIITGYEFLLLSGEFLGASLMYLAWNLLRFFIYSAFTRTFGKIIRRDNPNNPIIADVQNTIVLPYLVFIYEMYSSDISYHLLYLSPSDTIFAVGLVGNHACDLLQILYTFREDVQLTIEQTLGSWRTFWNRRHVAPADSKNTENRAGAAMPTISTASTAASLSASLALKSNNQDDVGTSRISESATFRSDGHHGTSDTPNEPRNLKTADVAGSRILESPTTTNKFTSGSAWALTARAAAAIKSMSHLQDKLAPFMWTGRFSALLLSTVRFAVYGSATVMNSLQAKHNVTSQLIFNSKSAVKYDQDAVTFRILLNVCSCLVIYFLFHCIEAYFFANRASSFKRIRLVRYLWFVQVVGITMQRHAGYMNADLHFRNPWAI